MERDSLPLTADGGIDLPIGSDLLNHSLLNKGTAFSERELDALRLRGLLPPRIFTIDEQVKRAGGNFRKKTSDLEKYIFLTTLQQRNETLFYRVLLDNLEEMIPIIYTPTVGQACLEYGTIFRRPRGLWVTIRDRGRVAEILRHWPHRGVRLIVVTDGERILGLGDLGALGMGIPVGKLALYTACAGVHPYYCLPITIDVGTDNAELLEDDMYIGLPQRRVRGEAYDAFLEEFVQATQAVFPDCLIQFEDFGSHNAFGLLERNRGRICCFNDDIQGTASVVVAGLLAAARITGGGLGRQKLLFLGAGEAATGIGELFCAALREDGMPDAEARARCWFMDSKGLVAAGRTDLAAHKRPFAHAGPPAADFLAAVEALCPTAIIGACGMPGTFTRPIIEAMGRLNERPVVFALSNPTSKAECTAGDAYAWSGGRAIFASGSPFPPVEIGGRRHVPGQGNNVYIFPGVGLGALASRSRAVTDAMFLAAARTLAGMVTPGDLEMGRLYPAMTQIREVSARIAAAVAEIAHREGLAQAPLPADLAADVRSRMFVPEYRSYV